MSNSLNVRGSLATLDMVFKKRKYRNEPMIHHPDSGLQYCSNEYQKILAKNDILSSITEQYDSYENAIAERINGILKQEFDIDKHNTILEIKRKLVHNSIEIYNYYRLHLSNDILTPNQMHQLKSMKIKSYKKKKRQ